MKKILISVMSSVVFVLAQPAIAAEPVVVVSAGSPYETLAELIEVGKGASKGLRCGFDRVTNCENFGSAQGIKVLAIFYKAPESLELNLADDRLNFGLISADEAKILLPKGKIRALK